MSVVAQGDRILPSESLFPLKLTPFEDYMRLDDRPKYPMSFFIEVKLSGELDRDVLESSLIKALQRHPLLTAHINTSVFGTACWHDVQDFAKVTWFEGSPVLPVVQDRFIDLRYASGLRVWAGIEKSEARIVFQFHHAVTDGVGAIQFIGDLLAYYGQNTCGANEAPELMPVDPLVLRQRGQLWEPGHEHERVLSHLAWWCTELAKNYPSGLKFSQNQNSTLNDPFITRVLDGKTSRKLKQVATRFGVTPNELYTLAMFQLSKNWNQHHGAGNGRSSIRIGIPFTLRTVTHEQSPAANVLSYMFLTRNFRQIADVRQTLNYIHQTSTDVLNSGDHALVIWVMRFIRKFPGLMRATTSVPARFATAMLANVGDVKRALRNRFPLDRGRCVAGNVTLEHLLGAAPTRPGTHLGLSLGQYAGKLYMNLNCDPWCCSAADANKMADQYVGLLQQFLASDSSLAATQPEHASPLSIMPQD